MLNTIQLLAHGLRNRLLMAANYYHFPLSYRPLLVGAGSPNHSPPAVDPLLSPYDNDDAFWFAVPKQKVTRSKKRLKTTVQKRIKLKKNIVVDPRTGEVTLMHKLPFNWKEYLPKDL